MPEPENGFIRYPGGYPVYNTTCSAFSARGLRHMVKCQEELIRPFDHYTWFRTYGLNVYQAAERVCVQELEYADKMSDGQECNRFDVKYLGEKREDFA